MDNTMGTLSNQPMPDNNDIKGLEQEVFLILGLRVH